MEANPYAAPAAVVDDVAAWDAHDLENRKAGRGKRLGAALLDVLVSLIWILPIAWGAIMAVDVRHGLKPAAPMVGLILLGLVPFVGRIGLVDPLLIFGKERRCLHDPIADTIVVDA